jgi:hypothetical protein
MGYKADIALVFIIYSLICYMFRSYDHLQAEINNGSVVYGILVNMLDNNSDRFLVIVDVVAVAALIIANINYH